MEVNAANDPQFGFVFLNARLYTISLNAICHEIFLAISLVLFSDYVPSGSPIAFSRMQMDKGRGETLACLVIRAVNFWLLINQHK